MLLQGSDLTQPWQNFIVCTNFRLLSISHATWLFCPFCTKHLKAWKPESNLKAITLLTLTHVPVFSLFGHSFNFLFNYGSERCYCLLDGSSKRNSSVLITVHFSLLLWSSLKNNFMSPLNYLFFLTLFTSLLKFWREMTFWTIQNIVKSIIQVNMKGELWLKKIMSNVKWIVYTQAQEHKQDLKNSKDRLIAFICKKIYMKKLWFQLDFELQIKFQIAKRHSEHSIEY